MNNKVVYLLGAGASAKCLPTDLQFANALRISSTNLQELVTNLDDHYYRDIFKNIWEDFRWLAREADINGSVDSYAKLCFANKQERDFHANFNKVKRTLSAFFIVEQLLFKRADNRYRFFLNKLRNNDNNGHSMIPSNVKILNWNYDFQMQLAANIHRKESYLSDNKRILSIINYWPQYGQQNSIHGEINMIHLNGIAGATFDKQNQGFVSHQFMDFESRKVTEILTSIANLSKNNEELLTFAFERQEKDFERMVALIEQVIGDADYLVIIGYSFPSPENTAVDKKIFEILMRGYLKKIYVQDLRDTRDTISDKFQINKSAMEYISHCDVFHMPHQIFEERPKTSIGISYLDT